MDQNKQNDAAGKTPADANADAKRLKTDLQDNQTDTETKDTLERHDWGNASVAKKPAQPAGPLLQEIDDKADAPRKA